MQSPFNLKKEQAVPLDETIQVSLGKFHRLIDDGLNLRILGEGTIQTKDKIGQLSEVHFHTHSEHTIDGRYFPLEAHFVFDCHIVLAIFFEIGPENAVLDAICHQQETAINLNQLLPEEKAFYKTTGSLTTPPYTEQIDWYFLKEKKTVSQRQIEALCQYYPDNYRPLKKEGKRILYTNQSDKSS